MKKPSPRYKPIQILPNDVLRQAIQQEADSHRWKLGPTVIFMIEQYLARKKQARAKA
jgi:hypothetical protein